MPITALPINCTLKRSNGEESSTDAMIALLKGEFEKAASASARRSAWPITISCRA